MALLPSIPTSFVPHEASSPRENPRASLGSAFGILAYAVLAVVFVLALLVFFYGRILAGNKASKDAELAKAQAAIDPTTVESFVHLRDRLNSGKSLLGGHVALTNFFSVLEKLLPSTVRLTSLHVVLDSTSAAHGDGTGVAKSFNALSAASAAFASDGRIKDLIFSKISINKDNSVAFSFSATLDPRLIVFSPDAGQADVVPVTPTP